MWQLCRLALLASTLLGYCCVIPAGSRTSSSRLLPLCTAGIVPPQCLCPPECPGGCCGSHPVPSCTVETLLDEFNGPQLNNSIWTALDQIHRGGVYKPENVLVQDGALMLRTQPQNITVAGQPWFITSGAVNTSNRFQQKYGIFKVRAMPYFCPHHRQGQPLGYQTHNTFWLFGYVPLRAQPSNCNCPEEIDVWEMNFTNYHFTGDERTGDYCTTCSGPFAGEEALPGSLRTNTELMQPPQPPPPLTLQACNGYVVSGAGNTSLNGCYLPNGHVFGGPRYSMPGSNFSLFKYLPGQPNATATTPAKWALGQLQPTTTTTTGNSGTRILTTLSYLGPCPSDLPLEWGWTSRGAAWGLPPHVLAGDNSPGTSDQCSDAYDRPWWPPPGEPQGCSTLQWHEYVLEWREHRARVWYDGRLVNEWSPQTWHDHCVQYNTSVGSPWWNATIDHITQPLFLALTACVMNDFPPAPGDTRPSYFAVDRVQVCE